MQKKKRATKTASLIHEKLFYADGCTHIFGLDEAGRGPWAGPVAAGAVCLPLERRDLSDALRGVRDSKQMTPRQREALAGTIQEVARAWGVGHATAREIDAAGINNATRLAMSRALGSALEKVDFQPDCLFLDYMLWPQMRHIPQVSIVSGDQYSLSIACASVLAKVWRDAHMHELDEIDPRYGFGDHKGYGTARHHEALKTHGPSEYHRLYYRPVQEVLGHVVDEE